MRLSVSSQAVRLLALSLLALTCTRAAEAVDPFGGTAPSWMNHVAAQKPYRLQIACVEIPQASSTESTRPEYTDTAVTEALLKTAKITTIAVAANDLGQVVREDGIAITYMINRIAPEFVLAINLKANSGSSGSENNTRIALEESAWKVMGAGGRDEVIIRKDGTITTTRKNQLFAVRIDPVKP